MTELRTRHGLQPLDTPGYARRRNCNVNASNGGEAAAELSGKVGASHHDLVFGMERLGSQLALRAGAVEPRPSGTLPLRLSSCLP